MGGIPRFEVLPRHVCIAIDQRFRFGLVYESEGDSGAAHDEQLVRLVVGLVDSPDSFVCLDFVLFVRTRVVVLGVHRSESSCLRQSERFNAPLVPVRFVAIKLDEPHALFRHFCRHVKTLKSVYKRVKVLPFV